MNINISVSNLKKIERWLCTREICNMLVRIIEYAESGEVLEFFDKESEMVWNDIYPQLKKSRETYQKWVENNSNNQK